VLLIVVGVTVVICEVWAVDDVVDPGTVSVDDAVGSSMTISSTPTTLKTTLSSTSSTTAFTTPTGTCQT
jgi:hypothetical protein